MVKCFTKKKNDGSNYTACVDFNKKTKKTTKGKTITINKSKTKSKLKGKTITINKSKTKRRILKIKKKKAKPTAKGVMTIQKKIKTTKKLKNKSTIKPPLTKSKVKPKKTAPARASTKSDFQLYKDTEKALVKSRLYAWNHRSPYDKGRNSKAGDFADTAAGLKKAIAFRKKILTKVKKMKAGVIDLLDEYNKESATPRALSSLHFDIEDKLITDAEAFIRLNSWEKFDKYTDTDEHMFHHKNRIISVVRMKTNKFAKKGDLGYMRHNESGSWSVVDRPRP